MVIGTPTVLNLIPGGVMKVIHVNQVNENIEIQFRIMNGAQPFNVPEGVSCTIRGTKGDNFGYAADVAVTAGSNIVTVTLTEQLTAVAGAGNVFELVFVGASDDMKVSTENFILEVERAALGEDTVISDSDLEYANQVLDQLQSVGAVNAQVQQNKANIAAEITRATAAEQTLQQNINAEAAARQAADNTLQSNINAEASSRATTDASLQSQIDQLVAPSGEAPSAAEVQNARIGTDGTVYPTLGDAIRTQNSLLKSHLEAIAPSVETLYSESAVVTSANNYYRVLNNAPNTSGKYAIKFTTSTTGLCTFQLGDLYDTSHMRDTIGTFYMTANVPMWVYGFTPSGDDYIYCRNSENVPWNVEFYEIYTAMAQDVREAKTDIAQNTVNIEKNAEDITEVENLTTTLTVNWTDKPLTLQNGYYYKTSGTYYMASDKRTAKISVNPGERYKLSTYIRSAKIPGIMFFNSADAVVGELLDGTGTGITITDYEYTVPDGVASMAVQSSDVNQAVPKLAIYEIERGFIGYTKAQIDAQMALVPKRYGVKWSLTDADDLGQRCFDAIGLTASIGVGTASGASDFDTIYPWSDIKRCNIRVNANGAKIITYEGESGFALDGSNGDVFVRVPKFYYERYRENGYEYRVVSEIGNNPHPAFVEGGKILDEIFVGAFEGNIVATKLRSVGGVIPTGNEIGQAFLDAAEANGKGYTLYDMRTVDAVWTLMAVEFGCRNTNQIFGYGWADFLQPVNGTYGIDCDTAGTTNIFSASKSIPSARLSYMPVGSNCTICKGTQDNVIASRKITAITSDTDHWYITFDGDPVELDTTCFIGSAGCTTNFCETAPTGALSWHTGRADWISGSVRQNPVRYRWMENLVGSLWHLLPDVTFNNLQMYACDDITKYSIGAISDGYAPIGDTLSQQSNNGSKADTAGINYWVSDLDNFSFGKGYDFGKTWDTALISTKAFGAYYYLNNGLRYIANGGGFDHLYRCNMLTQRAWLAPSDKWYLYGARLMYKHLA